MGRVRSGQLVGVVVVLIRVIFTCLNIGLNFPFSSKSVGGVGGGYGTPRVACRSSGNDLVHPSICSGCRRLFG